MSRPGILPRSSAPPPLMGGSHSGFPPIREIKEKFENFFESEKNTGFQLELGKISKQRNLTTVGI